MKQATQLTHDESVAVTSSLEVLALILARGGSKGIPRKNVRLFAGKPLIAYSIEQAEAARTVTRVVVSTDDVEIADVARRHGAEVPFLRPAELALDDSLDIEAFEHALRWLAEYEQYRPDLIVQLRPTEPVRYIEEIDDAVALMLAHPEATALKSVSIAQQTPYKMWCDREGYLDPLLQLADIAEPHTLPRQRLPRVYWQNGVIDIVRPEVVAAGRMYGDRVLPLMLSDARPPLDEPDDIPEVEAALRMLNALRGRRPDRHFNTPNSGG